MNSRDYRPNCDVLSISSYSSDSKDNQTPDGSDGSNDFYVEDLPCLYAMAAVMESESRLDVNDPLRYFLELGEITPNEYDKWKLVMEAPLPHSHSHSHSQSQSQSQPRSNSRKRPDFGPGHNSDSDSDDDGEDASPVIEYGNGYLEHANERGYPFDPWNPTPDTTRDRRYTNLAINGEFMLKRLTQGRRLSNSFGLKIMWERFAYSSSPEYNFQSLQDFWQEHSLQIYEALQDLVETQLGGGGGRGGGGNSMTSVSREECHTTPVETLENTFETIGRMNRCIAEDFNTPSVVAYVEEFLVSLYREIEFSALVKEYEDK